MSKARIITALLLIPIVIAAVFFLPPLSFLSLAMLVILLAAWEWARLSGLEHALSKGLYLALLATALLGAIFVPIYIIIAIGIIWWLFALFLLIAYPKASSWWGQSLAIKLIMGFLVLMPCWIGFIILQGFSPAVLMFCIFLIWAVDSAAYFVGKKWGTHKLAPTISPGKTYEGLIGGFLAAAIMSGIGFLILDIPQGRWWLFFIMCLFGGGLITLFGDLFESMFKRRSNVKDSGALLPGHGGILDRIDSMTTAIPFFAVLLPFFFNT
jgi:phosphatidate cytidylyltransferase